MAQLRNLTSAQVLLLAVQLTTESDLGRLEILAATRSDVLTENTLYRLLLTFLPVDNESQSALVTFLGHAFRRFDGVSDLDSGIDTSIVESVTGSEISQRIQGLRLSKIESTHTSHENDALTNFLIQWVHHAESTTGLSNAQLQLLDVFVDGRPELQAWQDTYLLPLWRLQNEFYPGQADILNLQLLESLSGEAGVRTLLQFAAGSGVNADMGRDLAQVVSPWVHGCKSAQRGKSHSDFHANNRVEWDDVYEWIYAASIDHFGIAARAVTGWTGPPRPTQDVEQTERSIENDPFIRYAQTILAVVMNSPLRDEMQGFQLEDLLQKAIETISAEHSQPDQKRSLKDASRADLMQNQLLGTFNPITFPSEELFQFLSACIAAQTLLETFRVSFSIITVVDIALFASEERQKQEFGRILSQITQSQSPRTEPNWSNVRMQIHQLRSTESLALSMPTNFAFLGRLTEEYIESEILNALLTTGKYHDVFDMYLAVANGPLDIITVKEHIITAIFNAYDNASNGNRTRGGMKIASDLLRTFRPKFPSDTVFKNIDHLIRASHSLSFYQLTLQHGVPLKPVNIRIHHDPLSLIENVLEQNSKAYTKLDDLLEIGQNLVQAGLSADKGGSQAQLTSQVILSDAAHRVTYLAITSALSDHDFDTAYSYITTRLSTSLSQASSALFADDTSWRAAYAAGKYRPPASEQSLHQRITSLSKRMDLLSLALTLTPNPDPLSEILATWRRCEEEMDSLRAQALDEERSLESKSSTSALPGGFAPEERDLDVAETKRLHERRSNAGFSPTYEEEAPIGLFDVARGAASAFKKSAFPLTAAARNQSSFQVKANSIAGQRGSAPDLEEDGEGAQASEYPKGRRKRDVVSGMVTGGLVSGMSWVLGAQPVPEKGEAHQKRDYD